MAGIYLPDADNDLAAVKAEISKLRIIYQNEEFQLRAFAVGSAVMRGGTFVEKMDSGRLGV